jgi:hypothetical protein
MASWAYSAVMPRLAWIPSDRVEMFAGGKLENEAPRGMSVVCDRCLSDWCLRTHRHL